MLGYFMCLAISGPKTCYCPFMCTAKLDDHAFDMREGGIPWMADSQPFECTGDPHAWRESTFDADPFNDTFTADRFYSAKLEKHVNITKEKVQKFAALKQEMLSAQKEAQEALKNCDTLAARLSDSDPDDLSMFGSVFMFYLGTITCKTRYQIIV